MNTPLFFYRSKSTDPARNLALEEHLLKNRREGRIFLLWQNAPCVILGKNQLAEAEVNLAFAAKKGIPVLHRITGGGAVYHDLGNVNFSLIEDYDPKTPPSLAALLSPIAAFLRQMQLPAVQSSRNDFLVAGKKVCGTAFAIDKWKPAGNGEAEHAVTTDAGQSSLCTKSGCKETVAQKSSRSDRILVHGCILFSTDLEMLARVLTPSSEKLARNHIASVRSRVANLCDFLPDETLESFKEKLAASVTASIMPSRD